MKKLNFNQFGVMSVLYQQYDLEYAMNSLASNGIHYIDFWGGATHYCAYDTPLAERQKRTLQIHDMMVSYGLEMSVFTAEQICLYPINIASSNPYVRKNAMDIVKNYLEDTKALGANYYFMQMGYSMFDEDVDAAYKRSIEGMQELCEYAQKIGVKMVMEQLQKYESNLCYNTGMLKKMIDDVGCPDLTCCVDCVAMTVGGETPDDYYNAFGGEIHHVHLADGFPTGHLCPGDGENPLKQYLQTFADHDFKNSITLEINNQMYFNDPDAAVAKAVDWLDSCEMVER